MYTPGEVIEMISSFGILITALGAVVVNIIVAVQTKQKVDQSLKEANKISHQVQEVHTLTNSNLSAVKAELDKAVGQLDEMKILVSDLKSERDKLAVKTALNTPVPSDNEAEVLEAIEENTEKTATNTKKTTEDVKELKKGSK